MSTNCTPNYSLNQWVKTDQVLMEDFNADNAKIDAALAAKANTSALNALQSVVNGKASQTALNNLSATVSGQGDALVARNCSLYYTTYLASELKNHTFTFPGKPRLVIFFRPDTLATMVVYGQSKGYLIGSSDTCRATFTWSENSVSAENSGAYLSASGGTYFVIALLEL